MLNRQRCFLLSSGPVKRLPAALTLLTCTLSFLFSGLPIKAQEGVPKKIGLMQAIHSTLHKHPTILLQEEQVKYNEGLVREAGGQFSSIYSGFVGISENNTPLLQSQQAPGLPSITTNSSFYDLSYVKTFRSGIQISTTADITRTEDAFSNRSVPNYAEVKLRARVPLLRGLGKVAAASNETASMLTYHSSKLGYRFQVSGQVLNTAINYWQYVAAYQRLDVLKASEKRAEKLVEETRQLIDAGERPRADLKQLLANLADKVGSRISGEQSVYAARQSLGLAMGLSSDEIELLAEPQDEFPAGILPGEAMRELPENWGATFLAQFEDRFLEQRADWQIAENDEKTANVLLKAAQNLSRPQLDLLFSTGYTGLDEGSAANQYFTPLNANVPGINIAATLNFALPTNTAYGKIDKNLARRQQAQYQKKDLRRQIKSNVRIAVYNLQSNLKRLEKSQEAIELYQLTVENEKLKFQQEISTIIDLIVVEDRLTSAWLNLISARANYAISLVEMRFETGTLIEANSEEIVILKDNIISVPSLEGE